MWCFVNSMAILAGLCFGIIWLVTLYLGQVALK